MQLRLPLRPALRFAVPLAAFILVVASPLTAAAQSINIVQESSLPRLDRNGTPVAKRPLTSEPEGINRQDCLDDQRIEFPMQLAGFQAQATLEAWASLSGTDCNVQTNRAGATATCWKISEGIPLQSTPRVVVPVRRILAGASSAAVPDPADPRVCGGIDLTTFSVQFLYFAPGQLAVPAASKSLQLRVDTVGHGPPPDVDTMPGDGRVKVTWSAPAQGELTVVSGWNVYCASNTAAAGAGCSSTLPIGTTPDADLDAKARCATLVGNTGATALVSATADGQPLANGAGYAFAVASVDSFGNVGPLSSIACESPFLGAPELDDGPGTEGSSCAASPARTRAGAGGGAAIFALALALAAGLAQRRRRTPTMMR